MDMKLGKFFSYAVCALFLCSFTNLSFATNSVDIARDLSEQQRNHEAYEFLKRNDASMGKTTYDLILGQVAGNIGKPDESAVACERVAINEPGNVDAKLCLAKAYFDLGQYHKAREILFSIDLQPHRHLEIQELKDNLTKKLSALNRPWRVYGKFSLGWDNNITAATSNDYLDIINLTDAENKWKVPERILRSMENDVSNWNGEEEWNKNMRKEAQEIMGWPEDYRMDMQEAYDYFMKTREWQRELTEEFRKQIRSLNRKLSLPYIYPQIGISGHHKLNNTGGIWYWDTSFQHRLYSNETDYDISKLNFALGINQPIDQAYLLDAALYYQEYLLNYGRHRGSSVILLGLSRIITPHNILKIYTENSIFNYAELKDHNVYDYAGGLEWKYAQNKNLLTLRGFIGRQQPRFKSMAARYSGNNYYGAKIAGRHKLTNKFSLGAEFTYQNTQFDAKRFENGNIRRDSFYDMSIITIYNLKAGYDWYVQCTYNNNNSNLWPYKYDHVDLFTGVSFKF